MGNHFSHDDVWDKVRDRVNTLTMLDVLKAAKSEIALEKLPTISDDSTVQTLVQALANSQSGAMLVTDSTGAVVASIDLFRVVRFVLALYEGATVVREQDILHERYDFWLGYDRWIEHRAVEVPAKNAQKVIQRAAESFFSVSIKVRLRVRACVWRPAKRAREGRRFCVTRRWNATRALCIRPTRFPRRRRWRRRCTSGWRALPIWCSSRRAASCASCRKRICWRRS